MLNYDACEQQLRETLGLTRRPVAITFAPSPPLGVPRFSGKEPAGCSFWRLAAGGRTFYTVPADHFNCAVGAYTHSVQPPADRVGEPEATLRLMLSLGYGRSEQGPGIPRLPESAAALVVVPLA